MVNKRFRTVSMFLLLCFLSSTTLAAPPEEIATKQSITTQVVESEKLSGVKEYPYPHMITGEALVSLIQKMVDFTAPGSAAMFNRATAQLFVRNTPSNQELVKRLLDELRSNRPKQIVIEARFVEIADFEGLDIGLEFPTLTYTGAKKHRSISTSGSTLDYGAGSWTSSYSLTQANELNLLAAVVSGDFNVQAALRALAQKVKLNTLSAPKITCLNNQRSNIRIATSRNYVEKIKSDIVSTTAGTTTSVDITVDTALEGVSLDVTPTINLSDDTITLELHPSVVSVDLTNTQSIVSTASVTNTITLPKFVKQTIDTTVTVPDGGTVILGGLIKETQKNNVRKVPFLGDIPLLGNLFKYNTESTDKSNLLIFITAHILNERGSL